MEVSEADFRAQAKRNVMMRRGYTDAELRGATMGRRRLQP